MLSFTSCTVHNMKAYCITHTAPAIAIYSKKQCGGFSEDNNTVVHHDSFRLDRLKRLPPNLNLVNLHQPLLEGNVS